MRLFYKEESAKYYFVEEFTPFLVHNLFVSIFNTIVTIKSIFI